MKQVTAVLCAGMLILSLNACSKNPAAPAAPAATKQVKGQNIYYWNFSKNLQYSFQHPNGLAFFGRLYVVDTAARKVFYEYDTWWEKAILDSQNRLTSPTGIAINKNDGTLYVADTASNCVQVYTRSGALQAIWGKAALDGTTIPGTERGAFKAPRGLAWDYPYVYVCDTGNNRIQKIDIRNNSAEVIDYVLTLDNQRVYFNRPIGVAVNASHCIYVTDGNNRVLKFKNSLFMTSWNGTQGAGKFSHPSGIAVSPTCGDVYVIDSGRNRVQVFDSNGNYINSFGSYGAGNGQFGFATLSNIEEAGIVIKPSPFASYKDFVYISDPANNRVQLWQKN